METPKQPLGKSEALATIQGILGENQQTGRMDSEPDDFANIFQRVMSGDIEPEEGVKQARALANSRQEGSPD